MIRLRHAVLFGRHEIEATRGRDPIRTSPELLAAGQTIERLLPWAKKTLAWRYPQEYTQDRLEQRISGWDAALIAFTPRGTASIDLLGLDGLGTHPIPVVVSRIRMEPDIGSADPFDLDPPPPLFEIHKLFDPIHPWPRPIGRGGYLAIQKILDTWHVPVWPESVTREGTLAILERNGIVVSGRHLIPRGEVMDRELSWGEMGPERARKTPKADTLAASPPPPPPKPEILTRPYPKKGEPSDFMERKKALYEWKRDERRWRSQNKIALEMERLK